ncbi:rhodanese-like domain-containing protein [Lutibaculum baratangense]|uniref:Sulfur carrier protein adenylyltransferase ThiF n=1 Tax=Lutibaculum baratangense AMV1 TaxID=631454 RepID=V4RSS3_9HYPH|nr:rhodanese-like domain-containing protein [Lutibaculum baratangense]ESR26185.1 Sulfur carrier protein adenylyltransferase ThiF [Lutibaculum baratangense AMV1]
MPGIEKRAKGEVEVLSPQEVKEMLDRHEIVLIDVRTPEEYVFEHIRGALLAPMADFDATSLPDQENKRIVFHCGSGKRSLAVSDRCLATGISRVAHMEGGFGAWKAAGLPYRTVDPSTGTMVERNG